MLSDEQLVEATLDGSEAAFSDLVERYQDKLLRFLMTRASSRADAEDAVQDTFISAYRYLESYDSRWRFSTWIYRIAIRNAGRQRRPEWQDAEVEAVETAVSGPAGDGSTTHLRTALQLYADF